MIETILENLDNRIDDNIDRITALERKSEYTHQRINACQRVYEGQDTELSQRITDLEKKIDSRNQLNSTNIADLASRVCTLKQESNVMADCHNIAIERLDKLEARSIPNKEYISAKIDHIHKLLETLRLNLGL